MNKLQIEQVRRIAELINHEGKDIAQVAEELGVHKSTVGRWIAKLRRAGVKVNVKRGPKAMKLSWTTIPQG